MGDGSIKTVFDQKLSYAYGVEEMKAAEKRVTFIQLLQDNGIVTNTELTDDTLHKATKVLQIANELGLQTVWPTQEATRKEFLQLLNIALHQDDGSTDLISTDRPSTELVDRLRPFYAAKRVRENLGNNVTTSHVNEWHNSKLNYCNNLCENDKAMKEFINRLQESNNSLDSVTKSAIDTVQGSSNIVKNLKSFLQQTMPDRDLSDLRGGMVGMKNAFQTLADKLNDTEANLHQLFTDKINFLQIMIDYVDAQKCVFLGYREEVEAHPEGTHGIGWPLWSLPCTFTTSQQAGWGVLLNDRLKFLNEHHCVIMFVLPRDLENNKAKKAYQRPFLPERVEKAYQIRQKVIEKISEQKEKGLTSRAMWQDLWICHLVPRNGHQRGLLADDEIKELYTYHLFLQTFNRVYPYNFGEQEADLSSHVDEAFTSLHGERTATSPFKYKNGAITYYEFATLLSMADSECPKVVLDGTNEQIKAFDTIAETSSNELFRLAYQARVLKKISPSPSPAEPTATSGQKQTWGDPPLPRAQQSRKKWKKRQNCKPNRPKKISHKPTR